MSCELALADVIESSSQLQVTRKQCDLGRRSWNEDATIKFGQRRSSMCREHALNLETSAGASRAISDAVHEIY